MSAPQKQTIERQAVETDTSQTQVAKQEAPRGTVPVNKTNP